MSIKIKHQADGTITIECGGQTVILQSDGVPIATPRPLKIRPISGKGAGHLAMDIPLTGADMAYLVDDTVLKVGDEVELKVLVQQSVLYTG